MRILIAAILVALTLSAPTVALAAFNGSIDATSGRPGDRITVVSDDTGPLEVGATGLYLMPAVNLNRPDDSINCSNEPGSHFLGAFERVELKARLTFIIPVVPPGAYDVRMDVPSASPSCWRLWPFEVLAAVPATEVSPTSTPSRSALFAAIALGALVGSGLLIWLRARRRGDIKER